MDREIDADVDRQIQNVMHKHHKQTQNQAISKWTTVSECDLN